MRRLFYGILFGILGLCIVGCTGVPYRDAKSSLVPLAPDQARITLFRESRFFGSAMNFAVSIDGAYAGLLPSGSVLTLDHAPGDLYLLARAQAPSVANASIALSAQPGQEYFVEIGTAPDCGVYAGSEPGQDHIVTCITRALTSKTARDGDSCGVEWCMGLRDREDALPRLDALSVAKPDAE